MLALTFGDTAFAKDAVVLDGLRIGWFEPLRLALSDCFSAGFNMFLVMIFVPDALKVSLSSCFLEVFCIDLRCI